MTAKERSASRNALRTLVASVHMSAGGRREHMFLRTRERTSFVGHTGLTSVKIARATGISNVMNLVRARIAKGLGGG